ncbi:MAG TPA: XRE family transcriptional regulator [Polyangium sp.]|nr:XRE family transcriptional regulator [Polyangium sp.]
MVAKVRRSSGDVFQDLGFDAEQVAHLRIRASLMTRLRKLIADRGLTRADAARFFGVTRSRIGDLVTGKIELFDIDTLVDMLAKAQFRVSVVVRQDKRVA